MLKSFSLHDCARELVLSSVNTAATPRDKLLLLAELFSTDDQIESSASAWTDATNSANEDREDFDADEDTIDADDFASALEEEVNDIAHDIAHEVDIDVPELAAFTADEIEAARDGLFQTAAWTEFADYIEAVKTVCEANRDDFFDSLTDRIASGEQDIDLADFARRLHLSDGWDWGDVRALVESGASTTDDIENAIHAGLC